MKKSTEVIAAALILSAAAAEAQVPGYYYNGTMKVQFEVVQPSDAQKSATTSPVALRSQDTKDSASDATPTGRISFKLKPGMSLATLEAVYGLTDIKAVPYADNAYTATVSAGARAELPDVSAANWMYESGAAEWATPLLLRKRFPKATPNDPLFANQWHLKNIGTNTSAGIAGNDLNITTAWDSYTGSGVNIAITDDGLQWNHPDILPNYRSDLDWDFIYNDDDPTPSNADYHGTACAGVAAAKGNNNLGGAGTGFNASLLGLRLIAAENTDQQEADALYWKATEANTANQVFINSNSWGPYDTGKGYDAPGPLAVAALQAGVLNGRSGKGIVYLWAAGNGRGNTDNINRDGYANSPYVIAVGASGSNGLFSWYSEPGAAMLVNAPSSGNGSDSITTTDNTGTSGSSSTDYTSGFGGTSSATPAAAGVVALMLQANPNLTYRDIMHILVDTATKNNPADSGWITNGAGKLFNHSYGFGRVNAAAAVASAANWQNVPGLAVPLTASAGILTPVGIPDNNAVGTTVAMTIGPAPNFKCEHVELEVNISHTYRGDLDLTLTSPSGVVSVLNSRRGDDSEDNIVWKYRTVADWGENPAGTWILKVSDVAAADTGVINSASLKVMGHVSTGNAAAENWKLYD